MALETEGKREREMERRKEKVWSNVCETPPKTPQMCVCVYVCVYVHTCVMVGGECVLLVMTVGGGGMLGGVEGGRGRGVCGNPENFFFPWRS